MKKEGYYISARNEKPVRGRKTQSKDYYIYPHPTCKGFYVRLVRNGKIHYGGYAGTIEEARVKRDQYLKGLGE